VVALPRLLSDPLQSPCQALVAEDRARRDFGLESSRSRIRSTESSAIGGY